MPNTPSTIPTSPQSTIRLCRVPWRNDYKLVWWPTISQGQQGFSTQQRESYLETKTAYYFTDMQYIRTNTNSVRVPLNAEDAMTCNYIEFINPAIGGGSTNKYAFIVDVIYINNDVSELVFDLDVFQTYAPRVEFGECFVEREHTTNDNFGANLIPENLEYGQYQRKQLTVAPDSDFEMPFDTSDYGVVLQTTEKGNLTPTLNAGSFYGHLFNGIYTIIFYNTKDLKNYLDTLTSQNKADAVISMSMSPYVYNRVYPAPSDYSVSGRSIIHKANFKLTQNDVLIGNIMPKNKKLLTYPYCCLLLTDNNGHSVTLRYEQFRGAWFGNVENPWNLDSIPFEMVATDVGHAEFFIYPTYYENTGNSYLNGLTLSNFPECAWAIDTYKAWYASQQNTLAVQQNELQYHFVAEPVKGAISTLSAAASGNVLGAISAAANTVDATINAGFAIDRQNAIIQDHETMPASAKGNITSGGVQMTAGICGFTLWALAIDNSYMQRLDKYFSTYGYKTLQTKIPEMASRVYWNYIKLNSCEFKPSGADAIPMRYLQQLKNVFINGVTLWHGDIDHIGEYDYYNWVNNIRTPG